MDFMESLCLRSGCLCAEDCKLTAHFVQWNLLICKHAGRRAVSRCSQTVGEINGI